MAAKQNASGETIHLSTYDWVGKGILNPGAQIKVPACGWCHPGGGPMEYVRNADGTPSDTERYGAVSDLSMAAFDGDFSTNVGLGVDPSVGARSYWELSGPVEADCLLCHYNGYSFGKRAHELNHRNYMWSATAGAQFGAVGGTDVYSFTEDAKGNYTTGTWTGTTPTVTYDVAKVVVDESSNISVNGLSIISVPGRNQCKQCHAGADTKKRGRTLSPATDIHISGGLECMDCHRNTRGHEPHQIGKGFARLGTVQDDVDGSMLRCADCHDGRTVSTSGAGDKVASDPSAAHEAALDGLTFHLDKISCETCHIPYKDFTQGELIDMSSGNQVWYLSNGDTVKWAGDFSGNEIAWTPFNKPYDPDGSMGPMKEKLYPFGSKTSTWFGRLTAHDHIQPMFLRDVQAAWQTIGSPKVAVTYVKDGSPLMKPSINDAAVLSMLLELSDPAKDAPVFVDGERVLGLDPTGTAAVELHVEGEYDHNFSINHDVKAAVEALGSGGCTDCHSPDAPLFETMQVVDINSYLDESYKSKVEPYAAPTSEFQGYEQEAVARLESDPAVIPLHEMVVSYEEDGAISCAQCHPGSVMDFKASVHYSGRSVVSNENFFFPGGGKHGMLDRACALVGSNMLLNMLTAGYVDLEKAQNGQGNVAQQCGKCHTNYYNTLMEGFVAMQAGPEAAEQLMLSGVDCLVCHSEGYEFDLRKTYEPDPTGLNMGFGTIDGQAQRIAQDRSFEAIDSIETPTGEMCLRCHEHGRTDYKRGELPEPEYDIHYRLGVSADNACTFCHEANNHKFKRGRMVNGDIFASDYPVNSEENDASCEGCHTARPHTSTRLNDHVAKLSCEACHITMTSGAESTIWADGGFLALAKGAENKPVKLYTKKNNGVEMTNEEIWEEYKQRPVYMQFSGLTSFLAQAIPLPNPALLDDEGQPTAPRIYPFKTIINPMPFDGRFYGVGMPGDAPVMMDTGMGYQVNQFSMFTGMFMFEQQYKMLGFMEADFDFGRFTVDGSTGMLVTTVDPNNPAYPTYAAMAQMAAFPNMLFFDKYTFGYNWYQNLEELDAAGEITRWDDRPLAAKDMKTAVAVGMGRMIDMMAQMGYMPPMGMTLDDLKAMYANFSDDQLVVMAAPPGSEMQMMLHQMGYEAWATYPAYSNGVTLGGHGVTREEALYCADCHEPDGVFSQPVEIPAYGPNRMPLFRWEFFDLALLDKAQAGEAVADVWAEGYAVRGDDFEMGPGMAFVTASDAASALGISYGFHGTHIAVLTPTTWLGTNWDALGYDEARVQELIGQVDDGGDSGGDVGQGSSSSECFLTALGAAGSEPARGWLAGLLGLTGVAGLAAGSRRRKK